MGNGRPRKWMKINQANGTSTMIDPRTVRQEHCGCAKEEIDISNGRAMISPRRSSEKPNTTTEDRTMNMFRTGHEPIRVRVPLPKDEINTIKPIKLRAIPRPRGK